MLPRPRGPDAVRACKGVYRMAYDIRPAPGPWLKTKLAILGAGPYGLAVARFARHLGVEPVVLGEPMGFWRHSMPPGMLLRSPAAWHFDPLEELTLERFITRVQGLSLDAVDPIPIELLLGYGDWFLAESGLRPVAGRVVRITRENGGFHLHRLPAGPDSQEEESIQAENVVLAPGFTPFSYIPPGLVESLPSDRYSHAVQFADPSRFKGARVLIIGGRQSAFEFAGLLARAGAGVTISYRHETPAFETSDWDFIDGLVESSERQRGWWRRLPAEEQDRIRQRFWFEGRGRLEPWLPAAVQQVHLRPRTVVESLVERGSSVYARVSDGHELEVDHVMMATGYKVEMENLDFIDPALKGEIETDSGSPLLDEDLMSTVPGLFVTGLPAGRDFGPFFGFMRACNLSARLIARRIAEAAPA